MMPLQNQDVCHRHGGRSGAAAAERKRALAEAGKAVTKAVQTLGAPINDQFVDPGLSLLELIRWSATHVEWLRERVATLSEDELVWGRTREDDQQATEFPGVNTTREAKPHAYLVLYGQWSDRHAGYCALALRAGIQERQVRLAEQQGTVAGHAIKAILDSMLARVTAELYTGDHPAQFDIAESWARWVAEVVPPILRSMRGDVPEPAAVTHA
jgi:hypothetical protein